MGNCQTVNVATMGSGVTKSSNSQKPGNDDTITLAILGLDNAGKTVTTRVLQGACVDDVTPTIGFSSVPIEFDRRKIQLYDLGGGANIRGIWHKYYADVYGFIFVIDASDKDRLVECQQVLQKFLENKHVTGKPVLLLANKQDVEDALDEQDICDELELEVLVNRFKSPCRVETCSAKMPENNKKKMDPSIEMGFKWLIKLIELRWSELKERVSKDVKEKKETEDKEKEERLKRVKHSRELREQEERSRGELRDDEDEPDELDGGGPFKPINQQLIASQQREAADKKNKCKKSSRRSDVADNASENKKRSQLAQVQLNSDDEHDNHEDDDDLSLYRQKLERMDRPSKLEPIDAQPAHRRLQPLESRHQMESVERHPYKPLQSSNRDLDHFSTQRTLDATKPIDSEWKRSLHNGRRDFDDHLPTISSVPAPMSDEEDDERVLKHNHREADRIDSRHARSLEPLDGHPRPLLPASSQNGLLQPIESGKRRRKKKFKLRNHRTSPLADDVNASPFNSDSDSNSKGIADTPRKQRTQYIRQQPQQPRLERLEENDDDDGNESPPSISHKWKLADDLSDDLPEMPSRSGRPTSGRGVRARRPNMDSVDDLVT